MAVTNVLKYVGIGKEDAAWGTEVAASEYVPCLSITPKINKTHKPHETVVASYLRKNQLVAEDVSVDFDFYVGTEEGIILLLRSLLGDPTSAASGSAGAYTHTFVGTDDTLFPLSVLVGSENLAEEPYTGMKVRSLGFSCAPKDYLICKASTYGEKKDTDNAMGSPTFSALNALRHADLTVKVDTVDKSAYIGAVSIDITNNLREGAQTAGSVYIQNEPKHTRRKITGSIELVDYDAALRTAYNAETKVDLNFEWAGDACGVTDKYGLSIDLGEVSLTSEDKNISSRDRETYTYNFEANYKVADTDIMTVVLTNTDTDA